MTKSNEIYIKSVGLIYDEYRIIYRDDPISAADYVNRSIKRYLLLISEDIDDELTELKELADRLRSDWDSIMDIEKRFRQPDKLEFECLTAMKPDTIPVMNWLIKQHVSSMSTLSVAANTIKRAAKKIQKRIDRIHQQQGSEK